MTPLDYEYLQKILKDRSGLMLSSDKKYLLESRLLPLARKVGVPGIGELVQKMRGGSEAVISDVVEAMTTNETFFFRDKTPFDHFKDTVIPDLIKARAGRRSLRIWCAAASTGQEPYSLAMILKDFGAALSGWRIEIVATDLSPEVLEKSRAGLYTQFEVQRGLPIQSLVKHFTQVGTLWQLNADVRSLVQFRQFNLLQDYTHLGKFDIIFCRNVLIYFDQPTKSDIFGRLARVSESDGYLFLGAAETVIGLTDKYRVCPTRRGVYMPNDMRAAPSIVPGMAAMKPMSAGVGNRQM
ncbi:MAG: protein-glutamate O-methyltransferase CheR [Tardiphaga sp.]